MIFEQKVKQYYKKTNREFLELESGLVFYKDEEGEVRVTSEERLAELIMNGDKNLFSL